jgi:hypothetical protein
VVTTGVHSRSRIDVVSAQVVDELFADPSTPPYLREGSYRFAVEGWATAEASCRMLRAWLATQDLEVAMAELTEGAEDEERAGPRVKRSMRTRRVVSVLDQLHRHETRAMHLRAQLGLSPLARARLGADLAGAKLDLARLWAEEDRRAAEGGQGESR